MDAPVRHTALITEAGIDDGRFLVRTKKGKTGEYILDVVFRGKVTHHSIAKNEEGNFTVNNKAFGDHAKLTPVCGSPSVSVELAVSDAVLLYTETLTDGRTLFGYS